MPIIALSITECKLYSGVLEAMDIMFAYYIVTSFGLKVELPMILYMENSGAVALANNWSVSGRTIHIHVKQNYLRELKERRFLWCKHKKITEPIIDFGRNNLGAEAL